MLSSASSVSRPRKFFWTATFGNTSNEEFDSYMRAPYFECTNSNCMSTMNRLGYHVINANLDTFDYTYNTYATTITSQNIFKNAINAANPGSNSFISLMHDVHETTVYALVQTAITALKAKGFAATTVGWCNSDHHDNWYRTL